MARRFVSWLTVDELAAKLNRSKRTVSEQRSRTMDKLGAANSTELAPYAKKRGWVTSSQTLAGKAG